MMACNKKEKERKEKKKQTISLALMASSSNMAYNMAATFQKIYRILSPNTGNQAKKKKKALVTKKTKIALIACWPANEKNFGSVKVSEMSEMSKWLNQRVNAF